MEPETVIAWVFLPSDATVSSAICMIRAYIFIVETSDKPRRPMAQDPALMVTITTERTPIKNQSTLMLRGLLRFSSGHRVCIGQTGRSSI